MITDAILAYYSTKLYKLYKYFQDTMWLNKIEASFFVYSGIGTRRVIRGFKQIGAFPPCLNTQLGRCAHTHLVPAHNTGKVRRSN